jgi:hypothetical protein
MPQQVLKDRNNNIIGYIETESSGNQTIKDRNNNIKGYYEVRANMTKDRNNKIIGYGNLLVTLL